MSVRDRFKEYVDEIDSVSEIYKKEFDLNGRVLDVGGGQGRLRHFLNDKGVLLYISVDPYLDVFMDLGTRPNLLKAYPCLSQPCNFIGCHAEHLPFRSETFDWVHMRSVLDHFQDPYLSLKEAYRVLAADGTLLIGSTVYGGKSLLKKRDDVHDSSPSMVSRIKRKVQREGLDGLFRAMINRMSKNKKISADPIETDDHMFRWRYDDLVSLLSITGFDIAKEHWQKPPYDTCVYISALKKLG
jgi:SAM-dependent methyltransferase